MRKLKFKLILFFIIISFTTVGFAAWTINVPTNDVTQSGDFVADDVVLIEALSNPSYSSTLRYNKNGFLSKYVLNENGEMLSEKVYDTVTYNISVNFPLCKEELPKANKFELRIRLKANQYFGDNQNNPNPININDIYKLLKISSSYDNFDGFAKSVDETNNEFVINLTINKESIISNELTNVAISYDFSNLTILENDSNLVLKENFFKSLSKIDDNQAFIVAASLYAIYD